MRIAACLLLLWAPASAGAQAVSSLRMRPSETELDAAFDGRGSARAGAGGVPDLLAYLERTAAAAAPAPAGVPVAPPREKAQPSRTDRILLFLDRALDVEASGSVGPSTKELQTQVRVDLGRVLDAVPQGSRHGGKAFAQDVGLLEGGYAAVVLGSYVLGDAIGYKRMKDVGTDFVDYATQHGPIGWGPIEFKDPNYGDPWVNDAGHPATYFLVGRLFRKRGYRPAVAFAGAMIANVLWEYLWENYEIPKSGHDILYMNLLGGLFGAGDNTGLAWGVDPFRFADPRGHYTEFYYRTQGGWRLFFRTEPNGNYNPASGRLPPSERPLFVSDLSLGAADEARGLTFFVTGVADTKPRSLSEVHGPSDVVDDVRLGVSVDPVVLLRRLR